jgi:hypothetical protein
MTLCQAPGPHHSDDTVTIYTGRPFPILACGYHAFANTDWRHG